MPDDKGGIKYEYDGETLDPNEEHSKPEKQQKEIKMTSNNQRNDKDEDEISNFFRGPLLALRKSISDEEMTKFASLKTNWERVAFLMKYPKTYDLPIELESYDGKNESRALRLKEDGNKIFSLGYYAQALDTYSRAILVAPSEHLPILLANRSAALYHMEMFQLSLADCDEALRMGYPSHLLYKLEERRARCALALNHHDRAMEYFKNAIRAFDDAKLPSDKRQKLESDILMMIAVMAKGKQLNEKADKATGPLEKEKKKSDACFVNPPPKIKERNSLYPALSAAAEVRSGEKVGRYVVATRDVQPGEIVAVERPHCSALLEEYRQNHCHVCFTRTLAPYPPKCTKCISIAYCGTKCRDEDDKHHALECNVLAALWCSRASVTCVIALKAIMQKPFKEFIKYKDELKNELVVTKSKPYRSGDYKTFYNLVSHEDGRTSEDFFHRAYMAAWLLRMLKTTSYIPDEEKTLDSEATLLSRSELFISGELLHNLQLLQFNCHEISELARPMGKLDLARAKNVFIGGGVYPTVALFNHSCNPGVVRYFVGTTMVVRAIRTIPAGHEISENYGPIFTETPLLKRQQKLRLQYWFDCACEACKNNWPLLSEIDPSIMRFKCDTGAECGNVLDVKTDSNEFMINCKKCGKSTVILKGLQALQDTDKIYKTASRELESGNYIDAFKSYLNILKILDKNLALPIRDYHLCQEGIRRCVLAMGNVAFITKEGK